MRSLPVTIALLVWFLFGSAPVAVGQIQGIHVRTGGNSTVDVEPGRPVTASFDVTNVQGAPVALSDLVEATGSIRAVFDSAPYLVRPGERTARLVTVIIPAAVEAGTYEVTYRVQSSNGAVSVPSVIGVVVRPLINYQVRAAASDGIVTPGGSYVARFVVENTGNAPIGLLLEGSVPDGLPTVAEPAMLRLAPGQSETVRVTVALPGAWDRTGRLDVQLRTQLENGDPDQSQIAKTDMTVLVRSGPGYDRHHYPLSVGFSAGMMNSPLDGTESYLRTVVLGDGALQETGSTNLRLLVRTPTSTTRVSTLSQRDEYVVDLRNPHYQISVGDVVQPISTLSGASAYGFGGAGSVHVGFLDVGAFSTRDRFSRLAQRKQNGGYIGVRPASFLNLGLNAVDWSGGLYPGRVVSLNAGLRASKFVSLTGEYGIGSPTTSDVSRLLGVVQDGDGSRPTGVSLQLRTAASAMRSNVRYVHTQDRFPSSRGARTEFNSNADLRLGSAWAVSGLYSYFSFRSPFNSGAWGSFASRIAQGDVRFNRRGGLRLKAGYAGRGTESTLVGSEYGFWQHLGFLEASGEWASVAFTARPAAGVTVGSGGSSQYVFGGSISVGVPIAQGGAGVNADLTFFEGPYGSAPVEGNVARFASAGIGFGGRLGARLSADIRLAGTYQRTGGADYRSVYGSAQMNYELPWGHVFSMAGSANGILFTQAGLTNFSEVAMTYRIPLNVPLARSQKTGLVAGRLLDGGTGRGVSNAAVFVGSEGTLTDSEGRFFIPSVPVGSYDAHLDMMGPSKSYVLRDPGTALIRGGKRNELDLTAVPAASISGRVLAKEPMASGSPSQGIANVLVSIQSGPLVRTLYSDASGGFAFTGLADGVYYLEPVASSLDKGYESSGQPVELQLKPGESKQIDLVLASRRDLIQFKPLESSSAAIPARAPAAAMQDVKPVPREKDVLHTIESGDTLFKLSRMYFGGDWRMWEAIYDANRSLITDAGHLEIGTVLRIPGVAPLPAKDSIPAVVNPHADTEPAVTKPDKSGSHEVLHSVVEGDTLFKLIRKYYGGDYGMVKTLYEANRSVIPNIDHLEIGTVLRIPGVR